MRHFRRLGLQVDHYNQAGYTALHIAAKSGFLQCAKILAVKGKASLTIKDKVHGLTPLDWSLKEGYQKSEVEFLKPSAKFYRLAKLTTTMAKYRKRSSVTSQDSLPHIADTAKPVKTVDKAKGKVKNLLKKSPQAQDDSEFMAIGAGCVPKQPKSSSTSKISFSKTSGADASKSKVAGKKTRVKASKQKSLTLSGNKDNVVESRQKTALQHSVSQPCPSKMDMRDTAVSKLEEAHRASKQSKLLAFHRDAALPDDMEGEIDSEDESSCSETETFSLMESLVKSHELDLKTETKGGKNGGVYCGEESCSSDADRSSYGILSLSQYTEAGVYCGDIKPQDAKDSTDDCQLNNGTKEQTLKKQADCNSEVIPICDSGGIQSPITYETLIHTNLAQPTLKGYNDKNETKEAASTCRYLQSLSKAESDSGEDNATFAGSSEGDETYLPSLSTKMEILDEAWQNRDTSLNLDTINEVSSENVKINTRCPRAESFSPDTVESKLDDSSSCCTEITGIEEGISVLWQTKLKTIPSNTQSKDLPQTRPASTDTTLSDSSSCCTEITQIENNFVKSSSRQAGQLSRSLSETPASISARGHSTPTRNGNLPNDMRERSCNDYLDISSSAVYSRRLQTKAKSNCMDKVVSPKSDNPPRNNENEIDADDDPHTDDTYVADFLHSSSQKASFMGLSINCQFDRIASAVDQAKSHGFTVELGDTNMMIMNTRGKKEEILNKERKTASSVEQTVDDNPGIDQTMYLDDKLNSLSLSSNENKDDSHCDPMISMLSEHNRATYIEPRKVNIYSNEQTKVGEDKSSTRIGQYTRDTRHIESIT